MPNRLIHESHCTSEKIASLTDFEFRLWVGLITQVDDAGRGDARPAIIKGRVFPFRDRVTVKDIDTSLHALAAKGCVSLYTVGGKPYFWFPSWAEHQRVRDCKPKFPNPADADENLPTCGELRQTAASCGLNPNPNPNPYPNPKYPQTPAGGDCVPYAEIVDFLNEKAGTNYKPDGGKTKSCIGARWREGFRLDDFKAVIAKKSAQWKGTDMAKYLRPETLFGPKFEGYLNEKGAKDGKSAGNAESQRVGHYL